ncbi:hypothetical protein ACHAWU_005127 [Discostella pseudostelligera]|uniref:Helicase C-terminal domain-containing protein n=1 Tax=Discostella pseudostelligera TaxID=259834 RepID=A0ABD3LYP1_9STRA
MTTAAGTSVLPNPHAAHLHLLLMLFVAPAAAFFAASPATSPMPMLATPVPATWRQEPSNFIFPTASSSWSSTILLSQQHQSSSDNDVSSSGGFESLGLSDDLITVTQTTTTTTFTILQIRCGASLPLEVERRDHLHSPSYNSCYCNNNKSKQKIWVVENNNDDDWVEYLHSFYVQRENLLHKLVTSSIVLLPIYPAATMIIISRFPSILFMVEFPRKYQMTRFAEQYNSSVDIDTLVATPGRLLDILRNNKNAESSLERRIMDALDGKSMNNNNHGGSIIGGRSGRGTNGKRIDARGRGGSRGPRISAASLSLNDIQEMMNDVATNGEERGGTSTIREMFCGLHTSSRSDEVNNNSRRQLKTLLFSATFPEQIEARVDRVLSLLSGGVGRPLRVSTTTASGAAMLLPRALSSLASSDRITAAEEGDSDHYLINSSSGDGDDDDDSEQQLLGKRKHSNTNITPIQNTMPDNGPNIQHRAIRLNEGDRMQALRSLLEQRHADGGGGGGETGDKAYDEWNRVLVFVATRYATEHVSRKLRRLGISASELHGKLDQEARDQRLKQFRSGKTRVLCATDLAARGIDVHGIDLVENYDLTKSVADYTHRTGRTGRAGSSGTAISFISRKSESHFDFLEKYGRGSQQWQSSACLERCILKRVWKEVIPKWRHFLDQFRAPMPIMIWIAIIIEMAIQNRIDMGILLVIQFTNASISFYELNKAGNVVAASKNSLKPTATCKRNGKWEVIDPALLFPGDLVLLASEYYDIPADCRVNGSEIDVDQFYRGHHNVTLYKGDSCKMGFRVVRGEVEAIVEFTGIDTFFGASLLASTGEVSHLQKVLMSFMMILVVMSVTLCLISFIYLLVGGVPVQEALSHMVLQNITPVFRDGENQESVLVYAALAAKWKEPARNGLDRLTLGSVNMALLEDYEQLGQHQHQPGNGNGNGREVGFSPLMRSIQQQQQSQHNDSDWMGVLDTLIDHFDLVDHDRNNQNHGHDQECWQSTSSTGVGRGGGSDGNSAVALMLATAAAAAILMNALLELDRFQCQCKRQQRQMQKRITRINHL